MKITKWIFWISTIILVLFEVVMPILTINSKMAIDGIRHLGYPDYFRIMLVVFKVLGGLAIILPKTGWRLKEWAYAGFAINFISASVSHICVDGVSFQAIFPLIIFGILVASYLTYHKLNRVQTKNDSSFA